MIAGWSVGFGVTLYNQAPQAERAYLDFVQSNDIFNVTAPN
jgi:hypothetical protein